MSPKLGRNKSSSGGVSSPRLNREEVKSPRTSQAKHDKETAPTKKPVRKTHSKQESSNRQHVKTAAAVVTESSEKSHKDEFEAETPTFTSAAMPHEVAVGG